MANELKNVQRSVNKYLDSNFTTTDVRYEGQPSFDTKGRGEWIDVLTVGPIGRVSRASQQDESYILNINIYSRIDPNSADADRKNIYRIWEIADDLYNILNAQHIVYYNTSDTMIGAITIKEPTIRQAGDSEDRRVLNFSVGLSITRER